MESVYNPLDSGRREIRLLSLLPSEDVSSTIRCELLHSSLDDPSPYEALTYFWGDASQVAGVQVNGQEVFITKNLELALRHIRRQHVARTLWVDAICINQADVAERNRQVSMMTDIYRCCERDIAWLGPCDGDKSDDVQKTVDKVKLGMNLVRRLQLKDIKLKLQNDNEDYQGDEDDALDGLRPVSSPRRRRLGKSRGWLFKTRQENALRAIFLRPKIWTRVWIVQELSCAPAVTLQYANETLDWSVVTDFLGDRPYADSFHLSFSHGDLGSMANTILSEVQSIEHQRRMMREVASDGCKTTMLDVLARFRNKYSTDPRDRIYGLLGLVSEEHSIKIDYGKSATEVFAEVSVFLINRRRNLDIICQNPWRTDDMPAEKPTWAADFSGTTYIGKDSEDGFSRLLFAQRAIFNAGRAKCAVPVHVDGICLRLRGTVVGRVGPILQEDFAMSERAMAWNAWSLLPRAWMLLYFRDSLLTNLSAAYVRGGSALEAYWRTLAMDCVSYPIARVNPEDIPRERTPVTNFLSYESSDDKESSIERHNLVMQLKSVAMVRRNLSGWTFCVSDKGLYLMVRKGTKEGDVIAVLDGGKVPVILRELDVGDGQKQFALVNVAYVHGFMDGEAMAMCDSGELEEQELALV